MSTMMLPLMFLTPMILFQIVRNGTKMKSMY